MAKVVVSEYLAKERVGRSSQDPMFVVRYRSRGGDWQERRMADHRVWKIIKALGRRAGLPELHPHAFRPGCGGGPPRCTRGNIRSWRRALRRQGGWQTTGGARA